MTQVVRRLLVGRQESVVASNRGGLKGSMQHFTEKEK